MIPCHQCSKITYETFAEDEETWRIRTQQAKFRHEKFQGLFRYPPPQPY